MTKLVFRGGGEIWLEGPMSGHGEIQFGRAPLPSRIDPTRDRGIAESCVAESICASCILGRMKCNGCGRISGPALHEQRRTPPWLWNEPNDALPPI